MYTKWRRDWAASAEYNAAALDLLPSPDRSDQPAAWNLGIAATALHDWVTARRAWEEFGITITDGAPRTSPIDADFGLAPVRLNADPRYVGEEPLLIDGRTWVLRRACSEGHPRPEDHNHSADQVQDSERIVGLAGEPDLSGRSSNVRRAPGTSRSFSDLDIALY